MKIKSLISLLLITVGVVFSTHSFAQQNEMDSLRQIIDKSANDTMVFDALSQLSILYQSRNLDTAIIYGKKMIEVSKKIQSKPSIASSYNNLGVSYYYKGDMENAIECWKNNIDIAKQIDDKAQLTKSYNNIGLAYTNQGNYSLAISYQKMSLDISRELNDISTLAKTYNNIGILYYSQGLFDQAIENFTLAMDYSLQNDDKKGVANCCNNIGNIQMYRGEYSKSLDNFNKAIELYEGLKFTKGVASCYLNSGSIYMYQGNFDKSVKSIKKAIVLYQQLEDNHSLSQCFSNLGSTYQEQGKSSNTNQVKADSLYKLAIYNYNKSLEISTLNKDLKQTYICNVNIGGVHYERNEYEEARGYYQKALEVAELLNDNNGISVLYQNFAGLHIGIANNSKELDIKKTELDEAIIYANKALELKKEMSVRSNYEYINLYISYWSLKNDSLASVYLNHTIDLDNENILMNFSFISENEKSLFFETIKEHYWQYNSFVLQNTDSYPNMVETIYNNTVKNKGLLLKSNTAMRNAIYSSKDSTLMQDYDNWIELKRQIAKNYTDGKAVTNLENKADSLEGYLVKNSNEFSDFKKVQNISWKQVQSELKDNEAAIEFLHFPLFNPDSSLLDFTEEIQYVALIITPQSQHPQMVSLFTEKDLQTILGKFGGNNLKYIQEIYGDNSLYNLIWKPMEGSLKGVKKVYLSPDGLLHKVSFPAIAKGQDIFLCDVYDIEVKSSTGKIVGGMDGNIHNSENKISTATLFGGIDYNTDSTSYKGWNYLEGTKTETQKINKILKKGKIEVNYFSNTSATEEEFKLMASNSSILHIATHGFFYPDPKEITEEVQEVQIIESGEILFRGGSRGFGVSSFVENPNPLMRSGLVFSGANDVWSMQSKNDSVDDGVLTAQEVAHIDMRKTELVVMSACETGLGDIKGSEGVYGLQRAFKMAGVNYMIMSLWQVPDKETEEFMTTFYKKLIEQNDIKKSFNQTQMEMRKKYDPYFWAAFVLIE